MGMYVGILMCCYIHVRELPERQSVGTKGWMIERLEVIRWADAGTDGTEWK
jgi:hypothetical protein